MATCEHDRQDDVCWECKDAQLAALQGQLDEARSDVVEAAGALLVDMPDPGTDMSRVMLANAMMRRERDTLQAQLVEARGWDVRTQLQILQASGLDGISHEDGWTLMETQTANTLRAQLAASEARVLTLREASKEPLRILGALRRVEAEFIASGNKPIMSKKIWSAIRDAHAALEKALAATAPPGTETP